MSVEYSYGEIISPSRLLVGPESNDIYVIDRTLHEKTYFRREDVKQDKVVWAKSTTKGNLDSSWTISTNEKYLYHCLSHSYEAR